MCDVVCHCDLQKRQSDFEILGRETETIPPPAFVWTARMSHAFSTHEMTVWTSTLIYWDPSTTATLAKYDPS